MVNGEFINKIYNNNFIFFLKEMLFISFYGVSIINFLVAILQRLFKISINSVLLFFFFTIKNMSHNLQILCK